MNTPIEAGRYKGTANTAPALIESVNDIAKLMEYPVRIVIEGTGSTLDYKAVLNIWFRAISEQLTERGHPLTPDEAHDILCHKFLGYTKKRTIGRTVIEPALITITYPKQKTRGELYDFCRKIEEWCSQVGVTLPEKESQYSQDKARQDQ